MDTKAYEDIFARVLDDRKVSRGERKALRELLEEAEPSERERGILAHTAFESAAQRVRNPHDREVIPALGDLVNIVRPLAAPSAETGRFAEVHFSPMQGSWRRIVQLIDDTQQSLDICVYTITDDRLASAVERAHGRHVQVRIISDDEKTGDLGSDIYRLATAGIPVALDYETSFMHHKFAIFDRTRLLTGSYNWTRGAATRNWENFIVSDDPRLVRPFIDEFERLFADFDRLNV